MRACYDGPDMTAGVGVCRAGTQACVIEAGVARWGACAGQVLPVTGGETCNGSDDDCDGQVDGMSRPCGSDVGECRKGTETCLVGVWGACVGAIGPATEDCNGGDEDCDGMVDDGCDCFDGTTRACGPPAVGACRRGAETCAGGRWGTCVGGVGPDDRDVQQHRRRLRRHHRQRLRLHRRRHAHVLQRAGRHSGVPPCRSGTQMCIVTAGVAGWGTCAGQVVPAAEICNGADDDCNGLPDDGLSTPPQVITPRGQNRNVGHPVHDRRLGVDGGQSGQPGGELPGAHEHAAQLSGRAARSAHRGGDVGSGRGAGLCRRLRSGRKGGRVPRARRVLEHDRLVIISTGQRGDEELRRHDRQAFSCLATVGTSGCGFEHQLASAAVSLGFRGTTPAANVGFLRPDAFLAIAFITNEDDCSAPPDTPIFDDSITGQASPFGP